jgi:DNA polymerase III delta prime subunit
MARFHFVSLALMTLLLAEESLGKPEICRQHSTLAKTQWNIGDTFAYCALKDGQDTLKRFSTNFAEKFIMSGSRNGKVSLVGHNENLQSLQTILSSWIVDGICQQSMKQNMLKQPCFKPKGPLFIHLSGPSGVGKTLFFELLSGILFKERRKDENDQQRELHHCGQSIHELSYLEHQTDLTNLIDAIHEQLRYCPFSLFVLKNLHLAHKPLLLTLLSHLNDGLVPSSVKDEAGDNLNPESIRTAMFIFTSDFGAYNASLSAKEARNEVRVSVRKQFDDELQIKKSNLSKFIGKVFVDNVETFLPLSPQELGHVADLELDKIQQRIRRHSSFQEWKGSLKCDANCSSHLASACFRNQFDCASRMVHGLKHFLSDEIYLRLFDLKFSDANFNSSDMNIVIEHDELHLVPERIPERPKRGGAATALSDM